MALCYNYFWKNGTVDCIAKNQPWIENTNLKINGTWVTSNSNTINLKKLQMVRPVFVRATIPDSSNIPDDGLVFQIIGKQNEKKIVGYAVITEENTDTWFYIVDPDDYDPTSNINCYFDEIISITALSPTIDDATISIGTGRTPGESIEGFLPLITVDIHDTFQNISWSVQAGINDINAPVPIATMSILGTSFSLNNSKDNINLISDNVFFEIIEEFITENGTNNYYSNILCKNILIVIKKIDKDYTNFQLSYTQL